MRLSEMAELAKSSAPYSIPFLQQIFIYFYCADWPMNPVRRTQRAITQRFDFKNVRTGSVVHTVLVPNENVSVALETYHRAAKLIGLYVDQATVHWEDVYEIHLDITWHQLQTFIGLLEMKKLTQEYGFKYEV